MKTSDVLKRMASLQSGLASGDVRLAAAGLLADARIFVLPHYD